MGGHVEGHHPKPGAQQRLYKVHQLRAISLPTMDQKHRWPTAPAPAGNLLLAHGEVRRCSRPPGDLRRRPARRSSGREEPPRRALLGDGGSDGGDDLKSQPDNPQLRGSSRRLVLGRQLAPGSGHPTSVAGGVLPTRISMKQVSVETALATKAPGLVPGSEQGLSANRILADCTSIWHLHHRSFSRGGRKMSGILTFAILLVRPYYFTKTFAKMGFAALEIP